MLGAELTPEQRRITGEFCRDNGIGFHGASHEQKSQWAKDTFQKRKRENLDDLWIYWASEEGRRKRASMGGKASWESGNNIPPALKYPEEHSKWASLGGKSHTGKKAMHKPGDKSFIRVPPEEIDQKLSEGYVFGSPHSPRKGAKLAWVHNTEKHKSKLIDKSELSDYLSSGWLRGRGGY